jgi:hypothetical protein
MTESPPRRGVDLSRLDLGELDSASDLHFLEYAVELPILDQIRTKASSIIVGPKGSGKTAIRLQLAATMPSSQTIVVSEADSFDVSDLRTNTPNEIKKKIQAFLIGLVVRHLNSHLEFDTSSLQDFTDTPVYSILAKVARSTKISPPFVSVALSDLFPEDKKSSVAYLLSGDLLGRVADIIGSRPILLLIDDVDSFVTSERSGKRTDVLTQILYAITDLNLRLLRNHVWITAFIKSEIFKEIRKSATELDKARNYIQNVAWTSTDLRRVIERRIEWNLGKQGVDSSCLSNIFIPSSEPKVTEFFQRLLSMAVNGPRNAIDLFKRCIDKAAQRGGKKISAKEIDDVAFQYGSDVITSLSSFYQNVYPEVDQLIDLLFREFDSEFSRSNLEERIKSEFLNKANVKQEFGQGWSTKCTAYRLVEIFYEIGVIGVFNPIRKTFVYSFEEPDARLGVQDQLGVHPGLRIFLETQ